MNLVKHTQPRRDRRGALIPFVSLFTVVLTPVLTLVLTLVALPFVAAAQTTSGADLFEKQVRPVFAQQCYLCHSKASQPAMGGLRLDTEEAFRKGGTRGSLVSADEPDKSLLLRALSHVDDKLSMPPTGKLADAEMVAITRWVRMGAPWGEEVAAASSSDGPAEGNFWSFVPPTKPPLPAVRDEAWAKSPIDRFVLAGLEEKGLAPAAPADKRTLIRRATFDLIGLPPTPDEVHAFLADDSPDAFARVVDRLLASPRYGERWGRHWLDVARYADSNGLDENLVYKNAFRYRDYVIAAFNKDKPYDQFVREQIAGDLLPGTVDLETEYERKTATGFLTLGAKMLAEDDPVKMQMDIVDEQLETTARAFMGLTVGCARCHDHKFDPIPTADYYAMAGIFKSSKTMENFKVVAEWHEFVLAPADDRAALQTHLDKIKAKQDAIEAVTKAEDLKLISVGRQKVDAYLLAATEALEYEGIKLRPVAGDSPEAPPGTTVREAGRFERGNVNRSLEKGETNVPKSDNEKEDNAKDGAADKEPYFAEFDLELAAAGHYQIDLLASETGKGTADLYVNGELMKTGLEPITNRVASPDAGGWSSIGIFPFATGKNVIRLEHNDRFPYFEKLLIAPNPLPEGTPIPKTRDQLAREFDVNPGFLQQWIERLRRSKGAPASVFFGWHVYGTDQSLEDWSSPAAGLFREFKPASREELADRHGDLFRQAVGEWQALYPDSEADFGKNERYKKDEDERKLPDAGLEALRKVVYEKYGPFRPPPDSKQYFPEQGRAEIARIAKERKTLEDGTPEYPRAMGVTEGEVADIPIHIRGSHWTLADEPQPRGFLRAVSFGEDPSIPHAESGRLQLARWLTGRDHPLTSRVMVNRLWRWHFGRGIVASTDNFGRLGGRPSNQPLLDWLAVYFVESGWSIKDLHRRIMLSNTYQMSTAHNAEAAKIDTENKLLWRMNRRRLEAEAVRDAVMAISGGLDDSMGGSILSFKDRQYVDNTTKKGSIDYDRNLRAVYIPVVRSSLYDVLQAFDFADPSVLNGNRNATVVAPQALFMMNGSIVLEHTEKMAAALLDQDRLDDAARLESAYEKIFARLPDRNEIDRALTFLHRIDTTLNEREPDPVRRRLRSWQTLCQALISSSEFLYLD